MAPITTFEDFLQEWNAEDKYLTVHTSGSTGAPKPIRVEKKRMRASARLTCDFLGLKEGDNALLCLPLDYIAGKMMVVRALERKLNLHCIKPGSHPMAESGLPSVIDLCAMVPMQVMRSLQSAPERENLCRIRHLLIGGGSIHPLLEAELQTLPCQAWSTYGMTETLSHIALRKVNGPDASLWYRPFEGIRISLTDGECLAIHAPMLCPEVLHTHDRAEIRQTQDGHTEFRILGRTDNVISSGGIKIQTEEVESLLAPHLRQPFMITKCSDPELGEKVVLLTESTSIHDIETTCRTVLPHHWQPRRIICVDAIPLTPNGKPARAEAQKIAEGQG